MIRPYDHVLCCDRRGGPAWPTGKSPPEHGAFALFGRLPASLQGPASPTDPLVPAKTRVGAGVPDGPCPRTGNRSGGVCSGQSADKAAAVGVEPFAGRLIVREYPGKLPPEALRVVHFLPVAELVNHNIVPHLLGAEHQQAVEIQVAQGGAGAPAALLGPDGDAPVGHAHQRGKPGGPAGEVLPGRLGQLPQLPGGEGRSRAVPLPANLGQMLFDPVRFFFHQPPDVSVGHAQRRPDDHAAIALDLNVQGFSVGMNDLELFCHYNAPQGPCRIVSAFSVAYRAREVQ